MSAKLSRRTFGKKIALSTAGLAFGSNIQPPLSKEQKLNLQSDTQKGEKPNIVFISTDQHSFRYAGFMGHAIVKTPNLDRLASEGVVLENNYCGSPVCVPSRACMMTGMFPSDVNSYGNSTVYDGSYPTWGKRLRDDAGYYCWGAGKADLNDDVDLGFEGHLSNEHATNPDITSLFRRPTIYRINERKQINGTFRKERSNDVKTADKAVMDQLRNQLHQLVDPEAVTLRAFEYQNKVLTGFVNSLSEEGLVDLFKSRLGKGQATYIAKKLKGGMLS